MEETSIENDDTNHPIDGMDSFGFNNSILGYDEVDSLPNIHRLYSDNKILNLNINVLSSDDVNHSENLPQLNELISNHDGKCEWNKIEIIETSENLINLKNSYGKDELCMSTYRCQFCPDVFDCRSSKMSHMDTVHRDTDTMLYICPKCPAKIKRLKAFTRHVKEHQNRMCNECGNRYKSLGDYERHLCRHLVSKIEINQRNFLCHICSMAFRSNRHLVAHLKRHDDRIRFHCQQCNKSYKDSSDLRRHRYTHGLIQPKFECDLCSKKFFEAKMLRYHRRRHTKNNNFLCNQTNENVKPEVSRLNGSQIMDSHGIIDSNKPVQDHEMTYFIRKLEHENNSDTEIGELLNSEILNECKSTVFLTPKKIDEIRFICGQLTDLIFAIKDLSSKYMDVSMVAKLKNTLKPIQFPVGPLKITENELKIIYKQFAVLTGEIQKLISILLDNPTFNMRLNLPLKNVSDLIDLNQRLQDKTYSNQFVEFIRVIYPEDGFLRTSGLSHILSDGVLHKYNFDGRNGKSSLIDLKYFLSSMFEAWNHKYTTYQEFVAVLRKQIGNAHERMNKVLSKSNYAGKS